MTMRRRVSIVSRVALAAGLTALGLWPSPAPAQGTVEETASIPNIAESWYVKLGLPEFVDGQPELPDLDLPDVCDLLGGQCEPISIPNPGVPAVPGVPGLPTQLPDDVAEVILPPETLHVEMRGNRPVSRAFMVPDLTLLPDDADITAGTLILPVSEDPLALNNQVEQARFAGCLVTSPVPDGEQGRLSKAPDFDCDVASSPALYQSKQNRFVVDLMPFVERWQAGAENFGVALVPVESEEPTGAVDPGSTFHVAINGSAVKDEPAAGSVITYTVPAPEQPTEDPSPEAPVSSGGGIVTPIPPPAVEPVPAAAPVPPVAGAETLAPAPYALINAPWYTYRGVVFLPLAFLVAISLTGRALTRPLHLTRIRRG